MSLTYIKYNKNPKLLIITPLKPGDKISKGTLKTIKCKSPYTWISYEGDNNIPTNTQLALNEYLTSEKAPLYLIKIDNDIKASKKMLDYMIRSLDESNKNIGYTYCSFEYKGTQNITFPAIKFDLNKLMISNYISSNSMMKFKALIDVDGFVIDSQYERLLDYCLFLKMAHFGYYGKPCGGSFETTLNEGNVSNRGIEDYRLKYSRVVKDFIEPLKEKLDAIHQTRK